MKLFKKVAAAVLAGVMALSMVACGATTPAQVEEEIKNPATPATDAVIAAMNLGLLEGADPIENDATLAKKAQVWLDAAEKSIADSKTWNADYSSGKYAMKAVSQAMKDNGIKFAGGETYLDLSCFNDQGVLQVNNKVNDLDVEDLEWYLTADHVFKRNNKSIAKLRTIGSYVNAKGMSVGVATKEIKGNTYVIILAK